MFVVKTPLTKFNNDSWWFFTAGDFKIIANYLDIEIIISDFNKLIGETPEVTPEVEISTTDIKEGEGEKLETALIDVNESINPPKTESDESKSP